MRKPSVKEWSPIPCRTIGRKLDSGDTNPILPNSKTCSLITRLTANQIYSLNKTLSWAGPHGNSGQLWSQPPGQRLASSTCYLVSSLIIAWPPPGSCKLSTPLSTTFGGRLSPMLYSPLDEEQICIDFRITWTCKLLAWSVICLATPRWDCRLTVPGVWI